MQLNDHHLRHDDVRPTDLWQLQVDVPQNEPVKWTDDIDRGAWLRERVPFDGGYATVAGTSWEAYARILHPARASGEVDGKFVEHEWTWAEAARRRGVGMHPLVDWNTMGRQDGKVEVDGLILSPGREGLLEPPPAAPPRVHLGGSHVDPG